jgi:hypothetical protein
LLIICLILYRLSAEAVLQETDHLSHYQPTSAHTHCLIILLKNLPALGLAG